MAENRVVIGLPARYENAKREIAKFEKREHLIKNVLYWEDSPELARNKVLEILNGEHDDD